MIFVIFARGLVRLELDVIAKGRDVQSVFVGCVSFGFRDGLRRACVFLGGRLVRFFVFFLAGFFPFDEIFFFFLFFDFFFFEGRTTGGVAAFHFFTDFVLLRFNEAGGEGGALLVAQVGTVFRLFTDGLSFFERFDFFGVEFGSFFGFVRRGFGMFTDDFSGF